MESTGMVFTVVGAVLLVGAVAMVVRQVRRLARWTQTSGTVVGFRVRRTRRNGRYRTYHHPQVRYLVAGHEHVHESQLSTSRPRRALGATVALRHDPDAPQNACIDELGEKHFPALVIGGIGGVFTAVGLWLG